VTSTQRLPILPDEAPPAGHPVGDLLASLAVAVGLPLVILAGIVTDFRPAAAPSAGTSGATAPPPPDPAPATVADPDPDSRYLKWTPEMSAMKAVADAAERRSALLEAQTDRLMADLRKARDTARQAREELVGQELAHRERLESFAYQVAGMTQRIADGRDLETRLRAEAAQRQRLLADLETQGTAQSRELARLGSEVTAWTELGRSTQNRLVSAQRLADARGRELASLSSALAAERTEHARTRAERQQAQALADQRLVRLEQLESASRAQREDTARRLEELGQLATRREQRIGSLERALGQSESLAASQAKRLAEAEATIRSLQDAVKSLSSGLVPAPR
jgi:chromosome segregation ATPase